MQTFALARPSRRPTRLLAGPRAITRASRRISRTGLLAAETVNLERRVARGDDAHCPRARARRLRWLAENICAVHGIQVCVEGALPNEPAALVANHLSYIDPLGIASALPLTAIAKEDVAAWPVVGPMMRSLGVLWVERGDVMSGFRTLRGAMRAWDDGVHVLTFPEGTTTDGSEVLPFKRGVFGAAQRAGVPVVPVVVRYETPDAPWTGGQTFLPHYVRTATRQHTKLRITMLPALAPRASEPAEQLAARARDAIARHLVS